MKIATYNVNGVNGRLPVLLRWLAEARPDVVCLQELKAPQEKFPAAAIRDAGYGAIWLGQKSWNGVAILARGEQPVETRRGLPGEPDSAQSRYIEAAVNGVLVGCLYLPNGNPAPGPKFDYKLRWFEAFDRLRREPAGTRRAGRARRRLQRDADRARRVQAGALGRRRPVPPRGARRLPPASPRRAGRMRCGRCTRASGSTPSGTTSATRTAATRACASTICCSARPSRPGSSPPASTATSAAGRSPATTRRPGSS